MQPGDRGDEREAEAGAGAAAARVEADEAAERALAVGLGDAGAAVGDDERRRAGVAPGGDGRSRLPAGAWRRALSTRFESASASSWTWPADDEAGLGGGDEPEAALLGGGLVELGDVGGDAAEVDGRELVGADAGLDPGDVEERGGGGEHGLGLAQRPLDAGLAGVGGGGLVGGGLELADQAAERAAAGRGRGCR